MPALIKMTPELADECASLIYNKWAAEYDLLKQVKDETNDGTQDWPLFHKERLRRHTLSEAKAKQNLTDIIAVVLSIKSQLGSDL